MTDQEPEDNSLVFHSALLSGTEGCYITKLSHDHVSMSDAMTLANTEQQ
jgi:hypothetical protein